jgi:hypothetical protein
VASASAPVAVVMRKRPTQTAPGVSFGRLQVMVFSAESSVQLVLESIVVVMSLAVVGAVTLAANTSTSLAVMVGCVSDRLRSVLLTVTVYSM